MYGEGLLEIDPSLEVIRFEEFFLFGFARQCIAIEVTTRHEDEFASEKTLLS